jgi:ATP-dependent DNA ligase
VKSRRGWDMTALLPELESLPRGLILDGELVALVKGKPHFKTPCARMLHGNASVQVRLFAFDVLAVAGALTIDQPYGERRAILDALELGSHALAVAAFEDGEALFAAVLEQPTRGRCRQAARRAIPPWRAALGQDQEPRLLALAGRG